MRILTVIESLGEGGAERALVAMLPALQRRGHRCEVAMLLPPDTLAAPLRDAGIVVHDLGLRHRWDLPRGVRRLARLARDADVVHAHNFFPGTYTALTRPLVRAPRRVMTFHNLGYDSFPADTPWRRVRKVLDGVLMRRGIDRRVAVSVAVADHYHRHLRLGEVAVVHNGFDLAGLATLPAGGSGLGMDGDGPTAIAVGRMVPEKAYSNLLCAIAVLRDRGRRLRLVIVGDGPGRPAVEDAVDRLGLLDVVVLAGQRSHDEVRAAVAAADVFVSSSTHEGFPLAIAEALALGTAVVATAVGGVPELTGDAAVLVAPSDPVALAGAIGDLLDDPSRRTALAAAGPRQMEQFSADAIAATLERVYEDRDGG